jgi:NitT/TauT family transport system permease protein
MIGSHVVRRDMVERPIRPDDGNPAVLVAQIELAWEWGTAFTLLDPFFFSRPSDIVRRLAQWIATGSLWANVGTTVAEAVL